MVRHPNFLRGREGVLVHGKGSAAGEPRSQEAEEGQAEDAAGFVALFAVNERRRRARRKEEMKAKLAFGSPLYLYAERARPKLGMIQLRCVDDGLSSLRRGDLGKYRFESDGDERGGSGVRALNVQRPLALRCATSPRLPRACYHQGSSPGPP